MEILKYILTIVYVLDCLGLIVVVLMQEGKSGGLGALTGASDTYWGKNKGRTMEGALSKITVALSTVFIVLSLLLHLSFFN